MILYKILKLKAIKYVPVSIHMKRNEDFSALGRGAKFSTIPRKKILILLSLYGHRLIIKENLRGMQREPSINLKVLLIYANEWE